MGSHEFPGLTGEQVAALIAGGTLPASFTTLLAGSAAFSVNASGHTRIGTSNTGDEAAVAYLLRGDKDYAFFYRNTAGSEMFSVDQTGKVNLTSIGFLGASPILNVGANGRVTVGDVRATYFQDINAARGYFETNISNYNFRLQNRVAGNIPLNILGHASQSVDLLQVLLGISGTPVAFSIGNAGAMLSRVTDAVTNAVTNVHTLNKRSTGTPAAGMGAGVLFQLESSTTDDQNAAVEEVSWDVATHASRAGAKEDSVYLQATKQPYFKAIANSTGGVKTAVNGATPVVRAAHIADPSGGTTADAEARTAINSILVALENFGILLTS